MQVAEVVCIRHCLSGAPISKETWMNGLHKYVGLSVHTLHAHLMIVWP